MIIVESNNFKNLKDIPTEPNTINVLDVVIYKNIFPIKTSQTVLTLVKSMDYTKGPLLFTNDPNLLYDNISPNPFPEFLEYIQNDVEKVTNQLFNACLISNDMFTMSEKLLGNNIIIPSIFLGSNTDVTFISNTTNITKTIEIENNTLLVQRESVNINWTVNTDKSDSFILTFLYIYPAHNVCDENIQKIPKKGEIPVKLSSIYLSSTKRTLFCNYIKKELHNAHRIAEGSQCIVSDGINKLKKFVTLLKLVGTGDWGNVYSACLKNNCTRNFAIKMARITDEDYKDPYTETSSSWYEIWMLKDIIKPLIESNICPNLPLFIDTFLCGKCDFIFRSIEKTYPCVITVMELASGDLNEYLKFGNPTDDEIYSALFQIMAALHAIQMSGQILNNDVKAKNILYYNVKPGGYWHYKINKNNFYVPNYGKMFVLNDFGVSTLYNPNFQLYPNKERKVFNLGSRYAININETFSPIEATTEYTDSGLHKTSKITWVDNNGDTINTSHGATYKLDRKTDQVIISHTGLTPEQKSYLFRKGVSTNPKSWEFFEHPYIVPPFEFYNDVQDLLRTFVGGKRSTQKGDHRLHPIISQKIRNNIKTYLGSAVNAKDKKFNVNTYHVLAGSFLSKFFTETHSYKIKPKGKKISYYNMNKCMKLKKF